MPRAPDPLTEPGVDLTRSSTDEGRYLNALEASGAGALRAMLSRLGDSSTARGSSLARKVAEAVSGASPTEPWPDDQREAIATALGLFSLCERTSWPADELAETLLLLGHLAGPTLQTLVGLGVLAVERPAPAEGGGQGPLEPSALPPGAVLVIHPDWLERPRRLRPAEGSSPEPEGACQIREADGLEPVLRLAALWQRVADEPLRLTVQGTLFKRDRERLDRDPALNSPITDGPPWMTLAIAPDEWVELAEGLGLLVRNAGRDQLLAAPRSAWLELGVHLPQVLAVRWLTCRSDRSAVPWRLATLIRLGALRPDSWMRVTELERSAGRADARAAPPPNGGTKTQGKGRGKADSGAAVLSPMDAVLASAYALGLVRLAESVPGAHRVVQLTDQGRYVLGLGPPPPPAERPDRFLFLQPNFDVIAYRQGLNIPRIVDLAMLAEIQQIGSAITLRLTKESVHRGLQQGLGLAEMERWVDEHSVRGVPEGVGLAIRSWSERRDRIAYYASATLLEFPDAEALEKAVAGWPVTPGQAGPIRVSDCLLLIEDEGQIPFSRFRLSGSRDYRQPPEACVAVSDDGIGLAVDPGRGDLFVEAEILRFADPTPGARSGSLTRNFTVTPDSLRRASQEGLTASAIDRWYRRRSGSGLPPAARLLWHGSVEPDPPPFRSSKRWILRAPSSDLMDGLIQHPSTGPWIDERLGPESASVTEEHLDGLRRALRELGIRLGEEPG